MIVVQVTVVEEEGQKRFAYSGWQYTHPVIYIHPNSLAAKNYAVGDIIEFTCVIGHVTWAYKIIPAKLFPDIDYGDDT